MRAKTKGEAQAEKTNITLKLDRTILKKIKILAAKRETSVSALVTIQIEELVRKEGGYEEARKRALARLRKGYDLGFTPVKSRDELYER